MGFQHRLEAGYLGLYFPVGLRQGSILLGMLFKAKRLRTLEPVGVAGFPGALTQNSFWFSEEQSWFENWSWDLALALMSSGHIALSRALNVSCLSSVLFGKRD